jgi:hypothetical protein
MTPHKRLDIILVGINFLGRRVTFHGLEDVIRIAAAIPGTDRPGTYSSFAFMIAEALCSGDIVALLCSSSSWSLYGTAVVGSKFSWGELGIGFAN